MTDLDGRTVLVTGAAGGLGLACARALAAAGASVALTDLPGDALGAAVAETDRAGRAAGFPADVTDAAHCRDVVAGTRERFGGLHGLVACAGVMETKPLLDLSADEWRRIVDVNLTGTFQIVQAAGRVMVDGGGGAMVLLSSVAGRSGRPMAAHYAASKAGVLSLVKSAAQALAPTVRVNAVCPGQFLTPMWDGIVADRAAAGGAGAGEAYLQAVRDACLLRRSGEPRELAAAVRFLVSDDASFVTGQALNVDGGLEMS